MYIFVRQDMSIQQQLVQACHAAHESGIKNQISDITSSIIIFGSRNKSELEHLFSKYNSIIPCHPFYEPYKNIGLTAFATDPIPNKLRHLFSEFKLWNVSIQEFIHKSIQIMDGIEEKSINSTT